MATGTPHASHVVATAEQVRETLAEYVTKMPGPKSKQSLVFILGQALGGDGNWPGDAFAAQVGRALDALAKQGGLVKVKANESSAAPTDQGWTTSPDPLYFRPEHYAAAVEKANAAAEASRQRRDRKREAVEQAQSLGLEGVTWNDSTWGQEREVSVSLEALEILLATYAFKQQEVRP